VVSRRSRPRQALCDRGYWADIQMRAQDCQEEEARAPFLVEKNFLQREKGRTRARAIVPRFARSEEGAKQKTQSRRDRNKRGENHFGANHIVAQFYFDSADFGGLHLLARTWQVG
jgi:hypothetical protein